MTLARREYTHDAPPGTDFLDADGKAHSVHYPMPSDSIHDPLVWKPAYKAATYWLGAWWVFWACLPVGALSFIYPALIRDYNMTPVDISRVMGWNGLVLALVGFILLPYASAYGRRPMILLSNLVTIAGLIWITQTHTHRSFLWARNVYSIGAGAIEFLGLCLAGDLFFTQDAGFWHAIGFASLVLSSNVGAPILGAFEQRNHGWRNFFWFLAGILIFTQVVFAVFFPETLWHRTNASSRGEFVSSDPSGTTAQSEPETVSHDDEKDDKSPYSPATTDISTVNGLSTAQAAIIANVGKGYPSTAQRYSVFPPRNKQYSVVQNMLDMLVLSSFGSIILFTIWWSAFCGFLISTGFVASAIWAAPPYNFGPVAVGCTNIPPTIGIFLGFFVAGPVVDRDVAQQAKRNNGVREAEMRLRSAIAGGVVAVVGLVIYGIGLERQWHWSAILIPGIGLNQFASAFSVVAISSYATDVYKQYALEIGFITTLFKNSWVFGLGYFMNDLYVRVGPLKMTVLISIPLYAAIVLTVLFLWIGKATRRFSAKFAIMQRD
ncbi:RHTO0S32e00606g1_1 [Rhodotorula toruloides]|uniref:RHTO0S32e00606g1_1 n=1 Tax=Rhodotorula toruloides TaxID=5286 RepID=A0A061BK41_RHOTO|nr:RHTO0S32e00606g1_1 [Rhodotorula toruloides]